MAVHTRNLVLFVALTATALVTWFLARDGEMPETGSPLPGPSSRGYYLSEAVLNGTDETGRILYRIHADRVEQAEQGDDLLLYGISLKYTPESQISWDISATRGRAPANRALLELQESVRFSNGPVDDPEALVFETTELQLYVDEFRAASDQPITLRKGQSETTAAGLILDLETDDWTLLPTASIRYQL